MCAQDGLDGGDGSQEEKSMIFLPKSDAQEEEQPVEEVAKQTVAEELPRTTTGVIRIMRAKGRPEMANLVEELHEAQESVIETTKRAQDLLRLLRTLQRKTTGTFQQVVPRTKEEA